MSISNVLSKYTYSSSGTIRPNLDKDSDGYWSKAEVENYAADYKAATGQNLDVAAIFEKHDADGDGRLGYSEMKTAVSSDALHLGTLTSMQETEETQTATQETTKPSSSLTAGQVLSSYTYPYSGTNRPNLDKDSDGYWSKAEVENYAADYKAATGVEIDVDSLFSKYDTDEDGRLGYTEYSSAISDDALGLGYLTAQYADEIAEEQKPAVEEDASSSENWLANLSTREKVSFVKANWQAETTSNLLNAMFGSQRNSISGLGSMLYAVQSYTSNKLFNQIYYSNAKSTFDASI